MVLDRNTSPYYDDFDEDKKYVQILFRPSLAVQARELSQMQSAIQKQIDRFGKHVFKEGSMVIPGDIGLDLATPYVKLEDQFNLVDINVNNFNEKKIIGTTSGAVAYVLLVSASEFSDPNTLFLKYETGVSSTTFTGNISNSSSTVSNVSVNATEVLVVGARVSGTGIPANTFIESITDDDEIVLSNPATATTVGLSITQTTADKFVDGETLVTEDGSYSAIVATSDTNGDAVGFGSRVKIQRGVYFALGYFLLVDTQTLILDKYAQTPSYKIGLRIIDEFVTDADDVSLVDPATGSPNFNAPGAHRYKIDLVLSKYEPDDEDIPNNFIELVRVVNGSIQKLVTRPDYSELEKTLARRTNDESGNYTVRPFPIQIKEHLDDGTNYGAYAESSGGDESKLAIAMEPGKAYVQGFEIESATTKLLDADKARSTDLVNNAIVPFTLGNYVEVENLKGTFNISTYETVELLDTAKSDSNYPGNVLGTARVRGIEFISGNPGSTGKYKIFLFDIVMDSDSSGDTFQFSSTKALATSSQAKDCDLILSSSNEAVLFGSGTNNAALMILPDKAVKTVSDVNFTVKRYDQGTMTGNSLTLTGDTNEIYSAYNISNYHVSVVTASATAIGNGIGNGDVINLGTGGASVTLTGSPTGRQVIISIPQIADSTIAVVSTLTKSAEVEKTKTLTSRTQTVAFDDEITLDKADIYDIVSILDVAAGNIDITDQFILDNGQRDNTYELGKVFHRTEYTSPAGNVSINYRYFTHGAGDYFSVDSYDGVIDYSDIQTYTSPSTGKKYDLRNTVDFRPRRNDAGTGFSVVSEIVASSENFVGDYEYYIPRIDKVTIDTKGQFSITSGIASINPLSPKAPDGTMTLYELYFPAYTYKASDVVVTSIDNKRYTMHDIGRLEKRIESLEYYTSLNLLEKDTADLFIDDGTGANRFKSGFLVDNFTSHLVGDVGLLEYTCAIDKENRILRPPFVSNSVPVSLVTGSSSNYQQTGDLITLPYTTEALITQPTASRTENINPYDVFNWVGTIAMNPQTDEWYETQQAPDRIIVNDDGLADSLAALNGQVIWNDWQTNWLGAPLTTTTVSSTLVSRDWRAGVGIRDVFEVEQLVSQQQGQTRSGIQLSVTESTNTRSEGDRVIATDVIPWIREKDVDFTCKSLKPNTRVYPFFDNVNVSAYVKPTGGSNGDPLVTNNSGEVTGTFSIPNNDTIRFRTGEREFKLVDSDTNNVNFITTSAESIYTAKGVLETKQETIISTRTAAIATTTVSDSRVIVGQNLQTIEVRGGWYDPLAQTFLIEKDGGVFVPKIDIFFATKDTAGIPVTLQIRNVVNGYPGQFILPFSEVTLNPDQVNISTTGATATSFVFDSPVYLQDGQEYCFVLLANSIEYTVWVSRIGDFDVITGQRISQQPYAGVMFKSQNASTWTADQEQDIKFTIHRCVFNTNVVATVHFRNTDLPATRLPNDSIFTTNASDVILINAPNHGLQDEEETTLAGFTSTINGVPSSEINGTHEITYIDFDTFSIEVTTPATKTGVGGGFGATITKNIRADVINPVFETIALPGTGMGWGVKMRDSNNTLHTNFIPVQVKSNVEFTDERFVFNTDNEQASRSVHLQASMSSTNDAISPVIDTERSSIIAITNRINNLSTNELNAASGDAMARYVTKKISLATPAISARVYMAAIRPPSAGIKVYIKYLKDSEAGSAVFDDLPYEELTAVEYPTGSETQFRDYVFEIDSLQPFSTYAMKVVMVSEETSDVPMIKDFRTIALGT